MNHRGLLGAGLALVLAACATEESPCASAAAQLTGCTADQAQAFIAACEDAGGVEAATLVADDQAAVCAAIPSDGKEDQGTLALTGVCVAGMYGVKWTVSALSAEPQPLPAQMKTALRPLYGSLVDRARIVIGARLPPRIVIAGHVLAVEPAAMTFGNQIFVLDQVAHDPKRPDRLLLTTVHELTHAQQAERAGGYFQFATRYCSDMIAHNFSYEQLSMEVAAYAVEHAAQRNLNDCGAVTCP